MFLLMLISMLAYAVPPDFVYRADSRPPLGPNGLFTTGFPSWGGNRDLANHEMGLSCGTGDLLLAGTSDSAYVSVADQFERARQFAARSFSETRQDVWIYTIRATLDFHDALATHRAALVNPDRWISGRAGLSMLATGPAMTTEGEYVALGGINRSLIREATRYRWNASSRSYEEVPGSRQQNNSYDGVPQTHANPDPLDARIAFPVAVTPRPPQAGTSVTIAATFLGACACMSRPNTSLTRANTEPDYNAYCKPMLRNRAASAINLHLFE
ncbi:hypothetical protein [Dyella choica]|nr:hypothetical protein [Dyella choica]